MAGDVLGGSGVDDEGVQVVTNLVVGSVIAGVVVIVPFAGFAVEPVTVVLVVDGLTDTGPESVDVVRVVPDRVHNEGGHVMIHAGTEDLHP